MNKLTLEMVVEAIRKGATIEELRRLVGPSEKEVEACIGRLSMIDSLDLKCEWESFTPSFKAQEARTLRERFVKAQSEYERNYC